MPFFKDIYAFLLGKYLRMEMMGHMFHVFSAFMDAIKYISECFQQNLRVLADAHSHQQLHFLFSSPAILMGVFFAVGLHLYLVF